MKTDWFTIEEVRKNVYAIAEWKHFERVVSYLFVGLREAVLFDTGMGYESIFVAVTRITKVPVRVLLTHTHWDHIGSIGEFMNVSVFDDPWEMENVARGFRSQDIAELMDGGMFEQPWNPYKYISKGYKDYQIFHDGDRITCDPWSISVLHTPGHSPGSVCFGINDFDIVITGDTAYPGPLYAYLPEADIAAYEASLSRLCTKVKPTTMVLPGHNAVCAKPDLVIDAQTLMKSVRRIAGDQKKFVNKVREQKGKLCSVYY